MASIVVYDVHDLQQILHVGRDTAYQLLASADFPTIVIGRKKIVEEQALQKWMEEKARLKL